MNVLVRRAALAALLSITTMMPTSANAACTISGPVCVNDDLLTAEIGGGGGDGVICTYIKLQSPPPSDWQNEDSQDPPYVFHRTQGWGNEYEHRKGYDWDVRDCLLLACWRLDSPYATAEVCPPSTEN